VEKLDAAKYEQIYQKITDSMTKLKSEFPSLFEVGDGSQDKMDVEIPPLVDQ